MSKYIIIFICITIFLASSSYQRKIKRFRLCVVHIMCSTYYCYGAYISYYLITKVCSKTIISTTYTSNLLIFLCNEKPRVIGICYNSFLGIVFSILFETKYCSFLGHSSFFRFYLEYINIITKPSSLASITFLGIIFLKHFFG